MSVSSVSTSSPGNSGQLSAAFGYAPGKIILLGEHAVVYGQPALAATLDRGIRVAVSLRPDDGGTGPVLRAVDDGKASGLPMLARPDPHGSGPERLRAALDVLVELEGERVRNLQFTVDGAIPAGSGLGSSAGLAIAMLRGIRRIFGDAPLEPDVLVHQAFAVERVFHGNPSGVDHSVIAHGGIVLYRRTGAGTGTIEPVVPGRRLRLAVGIAGPHAGTAHAVAALRDRARRHVAAYDRLYAGIGELVVAARDHLVQGQLAALGELMDLNQGYLNALGVSTPTIENLCATAREHGALGCKLTGAGGGGAVIALVDEDPEPVVRAFQNLGVTAFATEIDGSRHPMPGAPGEKP